VRLAPKLIYLVADVLRSPSGKILRRELREVAKKERATHAAGKVTSKL
jgi:acyl-CoA synthetase (AMP-forming)/AMP-acid ligase II